MLSPGKSPQLAILRPHSTIHLCLDDLFGSGRSSVRFDERFFDRVEVNVGAPLQTVAREDRTLASHPGQFDDFDVLSKLSRKLFNAIANFFDRHRVDVASAGVATVKLDDIGVRRFVPLILSVKVVASQAAVGASLPESSGGPSGGRPAPF